MTAKKSPDQINLRVPQDLKNNLIKFLEEDNSTKTTKISLNSFFVGCLETGYLCLESDRRRRENAEKRVEKPSEILQNITFLKKYAALKSLPFVGNLNQIQMFNLYKLVDKMFNSKPWSDDKGNRLDPEGFIFSDVFIRAIDGMIAEVSDEGEK